MLLLTFTVAVPTVLFAGSNEARNIYTITLFMPKTDISEITKVIHKSNGYFVNNTVFENIVITKSYDKEYASKLYKNGAVFVFNAKRAYACS